MQNKRLYSIFCAGFMVFTASAVWAQEAVPEVVPPIVAPASVEADISPVLTNNEAVDFPIRTSMDDFEMAQFPGINETNITGPVPMAPSVSEKDMPSERLLGRLTPEVFQEMAELERDNTFLKLQIQKETMKNDLEKLRAAYRQERLDEIAKREDIVRTRIQWWQEQEKIRQKKESQRAAAEALENQEIENKAMDDLDNTDIPEEIENAALLEQQDYQLINIKGTRGALFAKLKNLETNRSIQVQTGDVLPDGSIVKEISTTQVLLTREGTDTIVTFDEIE